VNGELQTGPILSPAVAHGQDEPIAAAPAWVSGRLAPVVVLERPRSSASADVLDGLDGLDGLGY
jgi:hypothetical protein